MARPPTRFDPTLLAPGRGEPPLPQPLDDPSVYGQAVYAALFPAPSPAAAALAAERAGILLVAEDVLQPVPWEYAHDGEDFLVLDLPFTRGLPVDRRRPPPQLSEALHVVAVPSDPLEESVPPLLIEEEWLRLVEEVEQAARETGNAIALERCRPPTLDRLRQTVANRQQRVVHFSGHGGKRAGQAILLFEAEDGGPRAASARSFANTVRRVQGFSWPCSAPVSAPRRAKPSSPTWPTLW